MSDDLIARLEAAAARGREPDLEIHKAVGRCDPTARYIDTIDGLQWFEHHPEVPGGADECFEEPLPAYTTSLDAALTLVPEGRSWMIGRTLGGRHNAVVGVDGRTVTHDTPALALCIAALKARAAKEMPA